MYKREVNDLERILKDNERIKRAEEIYYRRNHRNISINPNNKYKTKTYLGSKIILEMLVLLLIAVGVFAVKNRNYIFTQEFLNSVKNYNINLTEKFSFLKAFFIDSEENSNVVFSNNQENIEETQTEVKTEETSQNIPQQEQQQSLVKDVESLKNSYIFTKPIEGIVSSRFGSRESKYQNVKGEHTGIDIAAEFGTKIKSAISGTVTQVSTEGDYGNHIRIMKDNVTTLYAHCQDIYVSEGQEILEGQEIASVGSTGNSTGPHLHFEVRIDDIPINPDEIIQF